MVYSEKYQLKRNLAAPSHVKETIYNSMWGIQSLCYIEHLKMIVNQESVVFVWIHSSQKMLYFNYLVNMYSIKHAFLHGFMNVNQFVLIVGKGFMMMMRLSSFLGFVIYRIG